VLSGGLAKKKWGGLAKFINGEGWLKSEGILVLQDPRLTSELLGILYRGLFGDYLIYYRVGGSSRKDLYEFLQYRYFTI
jgi:hypothetical protein